MGKRKDQLNDIEDKLDWLIGQESDRTVNPTPPPPPPREDED